MKMKKTVQINQTFKPNTVSYNKAAGIKKMPKEKKTGRQPVDLSIDTDRVMRQCLADTRSRGKISTERMLVNVDYVGDDDWPRFLSVPAIVSLVFSETGEILKTHQVVTWLKENRLKMKSVTYYRRWAETGRKKKFKVRMYDLLGKSFPQEID